MNKLFLIIFSLFVFAQTNKQVQRVNQPKNIWAADWSSDGNYFALGGDDSTVHVYNGHDFSFYKSFKASSMVKSVGWHPKENLLAIANMKGVQLLDLKKEEMTTVSGLKTGGRGLGWNFTGELLALADGFGKVQLISKEGKLIKAISKHDNKSYLGLDWHPSKNIIATSSDEIILFDTSGKQLAFIKHRKEYTGVLAVKWHPSGSFFASGDYGHENEGKPTLLQFWKEDGTLIKSIPGHHAEIRNLKWSSDGRYIATASDALRIFSKEGKLLYTGQSKTNLWGIAWNKNNRNIVTGSFENGEVKIWNDKAKLVKQL